MTTRPRRRSAKTALRELHFTLRAEGDSPTRLAVAVALGTWIGCTPLWGVHLAVCLVLSRLLRLNLLTMYLAAHVNNPITAPFLVYGELWAGRWLLGEPLPTPSVVFSGDVSVLALGRALLLGSAVVGAVLAIALGAATWYVVRSVRRGFESEPIRARVCDRYRSTGILDWEFVRGKLWHDPLYGWLIRSGTLPESGRVLDLGCGRGIVLALVASARDVADRDGLELTGVERNPKIAEVARRALDGEARIEVADLCAYSVGTADAVLLFDVLHYLPAGCQERLLAAIAHALEPNGTLLIREADASAGWRFAMTRAGERVNSIARGHVRQAFRYRSVDEWRRMCHEHGLRTEAISASEGTPFGNVVIRAVKTDRPVAL